MNHRLTVAVGAQNKSRVMISHIIDAKEWQHVRTQIISIIGYKMLILF